jgi:predicted permease
MKAASLESLLQDLRYGFRMLARSPAFAVIAIVTLALGIGANTTIFSVVNCVLISPLPFPASDQLVSLFEEIPNFKNGSISYPDFVDWRRMNRTFTAIAAYRSSGFNLSGEGEPERLQGEMVAASFFEILGVRPLQGRTFSNDDDRLGANPTVMITEGLWKRKFGSASDIIGRRMILNGIVRTVIGVVPSSFYLRIQNFQRGTGLIDVYVPVGEFNEPNFYSKRGSGWGLDAIGRLKPGVTLAQAREDMVRVSRELATAYPDTNTARKAYLLSLKEEMVGETRLRLLLLLGAVALVLLISCVNVANLLLARSNSRQHEFAVRIALGAGQSRIMRQLLTESTLLGLIGGALGLLLANYGTRAAIAAVPGTLPRSEEIGIDWHVLLFTFAVSVLAGIIFGLAPAWKTARVNIGGTLKESGRTLAGGRSRTQAVLVVGEMALALVLLVCAGLMVRTLFHLWRLDPGYNPQNVMTFRVSAPASFKELAPDAKRSASRQIHDKIMGTPGVEAASFNWGAHPMEGDDEEYFWIAGRPMPPHLGDLPLALTYVVEPDYLKVMQIAVKRGRFFTSADNDHTPSVVVIDESFAEKYFPGQDPIGQYLTLPTEREKEQDPVPSMQVIGIIAHVNQWGLASDAGSSMQAQMYLPFAQILDKDLKTSGVGGDIFVRTQGVGNPSFETLRHRILEFNSETVVFGAEDLQVIVFGSIANERFTMVLLGCFSGLALLLACVGIYGVLSYLVGQRTQEIGVRMALGAQQVDVLRMVIADGARMTLLGVAVGAAVALLFARLMSSMLFGVQPTDPVTFVVVAVVLCAVALLACYVPARRAMKVNPVIALRYE